MDGNNYIINMKKSDREKIYNKYGGRCAYCGDPLSKGWHVDEIEPCIRKKKTIHAHWKHKETGEILVPNDFRKKYDNPDEWEYIGAKTVNDGFRFPERLHNNNQNPACASCNINKRDQSVEQFREFIKGFMKHLNNISTQYKIAKRYGLITETNIEVKFYFESLAEREKNR